MLRGGAEARAKGPVEASGGGREGLRGRGVLVGDVGADRLEVGEGEGAARAVIVVVVVLTLKKKKRESAVVS